MIYLLGMGNLNERLGEYRKAEEMYRTAIKANDREGIASNNLAWLIVLQRPAGQRGPRPDQQRHPGQGGIPEYLDTRGMIYLNAGEKARRRRPREGPQGRPQPPKYFHLAQAYLQLNDNEKARRPSRTARPGDSPRPPPPGGERLQTGLQQAGHALSRSLCGRLRLRRRSA